MKVPKTAPARPIAEISPPPTTDTVVCLLDGVDYIGLAGVLGALDCEDQHRVTLDCTQVRRLGAVEIRTLMRFADLFTFRGGHLRLTHANAAINRLLDLFHCRESLIDPNQTGKTLQGEPGDAPTT